MTALYRFNSVRQNGLEHEFSFTLHSGETRLLQLGDKTEKDVILDFATGEVVCDKGVIEIIQGDRRRANAVHKIHKERRRNHAPLPEIWCPLQSSRLGQVGWVAGNGGLVSNLKIWENITLPLWYHTQHDTKETDQRVEYWLKLLGLDPAIYVDFMAAMPYSVPPWKRKLAGLLRALVLMPQVLIVDAVVFEDVKTQLTEKWIAALEAYANQGRAVLILADKATFVPWKKIE